MGAGLARDHAVRRRAEAMTRHEQLCRVEQRVSRGGTADGRRRPHSDCIHRCLLESGVCGMPRIVGQRAARAVSPTAEPRVGSAPTMDASDRRGRDARRSRASSAGWLPRPGRRTWHRGAHDLAAAVDVGDHDVAHLAESPVGVPEAIFDRLRRARGHGARQTPHAGVRGPRHARLRTSRCRAPAQACGRETQARRDCSTCTLARRRS